MSSKDEDGPMHNNPSSRRIGTRRKVNASRVRTKTPQEMTESENACSSVGDAATQETGLMKKETKAPVIIPRGQFGSKNRGNSTRRKIRRGGRGISERNSNKRDIISGGSNERIRMETSSGVVLERIGSRRDFSSEGNRTNREISSGDTSGANSIMNEIINEETASDSGGESTSSGKIRSSRGKSTRRENRGGGTSGVNNIRRGTRDGVITSGRNSTGSEIGQEIDRLLMKADERGVYKRFLIFCWMIPACLVIPCAYLNIFLMLFVPPFNCTLPAPPSELSYDDWRSFVTPKTPSGDLNPCALYDFPSALKDPIYIVHDTKSEYKPDHIHTGTQEPDDPSRQQPETTHFITGTHGGDYESIPGTKDHGNSSGDSGTLRKDPDTVSIEGITDALESHTGTDSVDGVTGTTSVGDTGVLENNTGDINMKWITNTLDNTDNTGTLENDTDTSNIQEIDISTSKHPFLQNQALSTNGKLPSTANRQTSNNKRDTSTLQHYRSSREVNMSTLKDPLVHNQALSTPNQGINHGYGKSRVPRYFDPFDDLYDPNRDKKLHHTQSGMPKDPREEYREAVQVWMENYPKETPPGNYTIGCVFGYDFDKSYVQESLSMQFGWVCDASDGITRILHVSMAGNVVGSILFGILADRMGRKWVFLMVGVKGAILGTVFVLVSSSWSHLVLRFFLSLGLPALYQVVIISAVEQVRVNERGLVTSLSSVCFSIGQSLLGLIAWLTADWFTLGLVTSLPCILALVYSRLLEESPQWLVSRGREMDAAMVLRRITKRNRRRNQLLPALSVLRHRIKQITTAREEMEEDEGTPIVAEGACGRWCGYVVRSVVFVATYPYLCFRIMLLIICWIVNNIIYFVTTMKYPNVARNPYLAWFFISVMEVPANLLLPLLLRYIGRRLAHTSGLSICSIAFFISCGLLSAGYKENFAVISGLILVSKFFGCMTYILLYLQASELCPTAIRSRVIGLGSLVALSVNIMSPSILTWNPPLYSYLFLALLALVGSVSAFLLPETVGRPLPQTLREAENFTWLPNTFRLIPGQIEVNKGVENRSILSDTSTTPPASPTPLPSTAPTDITTRVDSSRVTPAASPDSITEETEL